MMELITDFEIAAAANALVAVSDVAPRNDAVRRDIARLVLEAASAARRAKLSPVTGGHVEIAGADINDFLRLAVSKSPIGDVQLTLLLYALAFACRVLKIEEDVLHDRLDDAISACEARSLVPLTTQ